MTLISTLPWYDLPATTSQLDRLWQQIALLLKRTMPEYAQLIPAELERNQDLSQLWQKHELLLSQCCGPDLFTPQAAALDPFARPVFSTLDCPPGEYYSHIVTAKDRSQEYPRLVINSLTSRSGCFALMEWLENHQIKPVSIQVSGSHQQSLEWLKENKADLAAIDAQSWNFLNGDGLEIIGRSRNAPAPPFVTHSCNPIPLDQLYQALDQALKLDGKALDISHILPADRELYRPLVEQQVRPVQMAEQSHPESALCPSPA